MPKALRTAFTCPLLIVRYDSVIGSFLGETAQRISQVFELARSQRCVLFFDEFDAIGKERGDLHETGEIKRVVSSLLLQIDDLPSYVVTICASNHPELLDRAVWRRFQIKIELSPPTQSQIEDWLRKFEVRFGHTLPIKTISRKLTGLSFAEIEEFGLDLMRRSILSGPDTSTAKIVNEQIEQLPKRAKPLDVSRATSRTANVNPSVNRTISKS